MEPSSDDEKKVQVAPIMKKLSFPKNACFVPEVDSQEEIVVLRKPEFIAKCLKL